MSPSRGETPPAAAAREDLHRPSLRGHFEILRVDHWFKNVFVLPGVAVALSLDFSLATTTMILHSLVGLLAICLVASSNYVINEVLDAPFDRLHLTKWKRPVPSGRVHIGWAYLQWIVFALLGCGLGLTVGTPFALTLLALWIMGCVYNIPPLRSKDVAYVDVITESVNNPIRMLADWFMTGTTLVPPVSLLLSYWMVGAYFMAMKRFAEYRYLRQMPGGVYVGQKISETAARYRRSFAVYTESHLLVSVMFYCAVAMLFFGAFIMRYRLELILAFPAVALVMAMYLFLGLDS